MCEHFEQDRTSFLACGAVHIARIMKPADPHVLLVSEAEYFRLDGEMNDAGVMSVVDAAGNLP